MEIKSRYACTPFRAALLALGVALASASASAQTVLFQENFDNGLGQFTATGSVTTSTAGARMAGGSSDGVITSSGINTQGFTAITLSFNRVTSGLDTAEAGIAPLPVD